MLNFLSANVDVRTLVKVDIIIEEPSVKYTVYDAVKFLRFNSTGIDMANNAYGHIIAASLDIDEEGVILLGLEIDRGSGTPTSDISQLLTLIDNIAMLMASGLMETHVGHVAVEPVDIDYAMAH